MDKFVCQVSNNKIREVRKLDFEIAPTDDSWYPCWTGAKVRDYYERENQECLIGLEIAMQHYADKYNLLVKRLRENALDKYCE